MTIPERCAVAPADTIPVTDRASAGFVRLVDEYRDRLDMIMVAARARYSELALRLGDRVTRHWAVRCNLPYFKELEEVATAVGVPGVWMLNFSYEWGCTTASVLDPDGSSRLLRVLDWDLAGLGRTLVGARQEGDAGPWLNLTWPGYVGAVQAVAPGRFAAAINQAPAVATGFGPVADWVAQKIAILRETALPPAHLLRLVFERCRTFGEALAALADTPLCAPVLFSLVGCRPGETALIERTPSRSVVHDGPFAISNHWLSKGLPGSSRSCQSAERLDAMRTYLAGRESADRVFAWLAPPIRNDRTRLALEAVPVIGAVWLQGYEADGPVTQLQQIAA